MTNFSLYPFVPDSGVLETDYAVSYVSYPIRMTTRGNRTSLFQCNCPSGDSVILQARVADDLNWVDVLETGTDTLTEIVTAPQYRVVVTNTSGTDVVAKVHI